MKVQYVKRGVKMVFAPLVILAVTFVVAGQQATPPPKPVPTQPDKSAKAPETTADFMQAADEVLAQMSDILKLPIKEPLKKSLRSKQEIRDYLVQEKRG